MTTDEPFGLLVYRALKRHPNGNLVTMNLMYADIQKLKVSGRVATRAFFPKPKYSVLQMLKTATPEETAEVYVELAEEAAEAQQRRSSWWGPLLFFWIFS